MISPYFDCMNNMEIFQGRFKLCQCQSPLPQKVDCLFPKGPWNLWESMHFFVKVCCFFSKYRLFLSKCAFFSLSIAPKGSLRELFLPKCTVFFLKYRLFFVPKASLWESMLFFSLSIAPKGSLRELFLSECAVFSLSMDFFLCQRHPFGKVCCFFLCQSAPKVPGTPFQRNPSDWRIPLGQIGTGKLFSRWIMDFFVVETRCIASLRDR